MKVTKLLRRTTSLLLALAMLFSFPAGVYSEGAEPNSEEVLEIPEGFAWRTLSVELAPFEEDRAQTEEEEDARLAEKALEAGSFLELMLSHAVAADEEASAPTVEVRGWMPEDVTAQAELISYSEKELYMETALMQAELRFYDGEGRSWCPTLPVTVCIDGEVVKDVRDAKMNPTVYIYEERPEEAKEEDDRFFSVEAFTAARPAGEEKSYERELNAVRAEVNERGLVKDEETPDAVCFEIQSEAVRFAVTARQPDRTYTATSEDGAIDMIVVGKLPRGLSAEVASVSAEVEAGELPGDVVMGWELSMAHPEEQDYLPEGTMKVALRDSALVELQDGLWDLQLWQLRDDAAPARVKDAVFKGEDLRFSAAGLSTFVVVKVAVEKKLTATDGSSYSVELVYDSNAGIPANAELVVRELLPEDEGYAQYLNESAVRMERKPEDLGFAKVLDVSLRNPETGEEFKPNQDVRINVELLSEDLDEYTNVSVVRFGGQETKKVNASTHGDAVAFETGDPSVFVVTGVCVEKTITAGDGSTYHVTVSYDKNAGIPEGAELEVRELIGDEYLEYLSKTAEFLSREEEQLVFARFFDITIVKDGVVYEPDKSVSVSIELMDRPETQGVLRVVHFGEETELLDNEETADGCLKFNTDSFSVYAITDEDGNVIVPRAFYHFYDGEIDKGQQIIKNQGTLTEVTHSEQGSLVFLGWFIFNEEDGSWGEQVFFDTPIQILMGAEEAVYGNSVVVPREKDADGKWINHVDVTVKTRYTSDFATISFMTATTSTNYNDASIVKRSEKVPMPIGETSTVYQIPDVTHEEYTIQSTNPDYTFVGWSQKKPDRQQDYYNDAVSATRPIITSLTVQNQQRYTLYPVFMKANWLIFKTGPVGSGAEYVAPVFILKGNTAADKIPEDPTWRGYKFLYWTTEPTFDEETGEVIQFEAGHEPARFNFNTPINARTTLYAYWESGYSTYTVITWIQSVNDNKNAAPQDRSYEFQDQVTRDAKVGEIVNLTDADKSLNLTGFHHKTEQNIAGDVHVDTVNASVASSGATVLNVYYDRDLMTMQFYDRNGDLSVPSGYNDAVWTNGSRYVKNYTGLYGQSLQQNGYVWPAGTWSYFQNPNNNSDVSGMSYLGQFVFPNPEIGTYFRAYKTGDTEAARIEFFLQNPDGSYPTTRSDYGSVGNAGTFNFTDKYDGFMVTQYRRYYEKNGTRYYVDASGTQVSNANDAWENVSVGGSTPLSAVIYTGNNNDVAWAYEGGGKTVFYSNTRYKGSIGSSGVYLFSFNGTDFVYTGRRVYNYYVANDNNGTQFGVVTVHSGQYNGNYFIQLVKKTKYKTQNLNLEIRYARRNYNISFFDSMDGQALTTLLLDGSTVQRKNGVLYGGDIGNFYPDPEFEPMAKEPGWAFNNRWYSDQGQTTQIFFHELTDEDQAKLWYYIDTSGEKIYIDRPASEDELTMTLEEDGRYYDRDKAEVIKQMPNRNLALYAGFNHTWYWVKVDPNGGYLNGNNPADNTNSTYFWAQYGTKIVEYPTYRTFVRDDAGTYYYHYDEFNTEDPNGEQPRSRKAYYTTNAAESTDGGLRYRIANEEEDEGFEFAGWYLVDENSTTGKKYQRFNFEESFVKENMVLRAMWKQRGAYRVFYSMDKALDPSGNPISGLTLSGTAPVDDFLYANDSTILVLAGDAHDPINAQAADDTEYDFLGWYFNNGVYAAGEVFEANPYLAERYPGPDTPANAPYDTFILYPVFQTAGDGSGDMNHTMLVLDSNGGYATDGYVLPEEAEFNGDKTQVYFLQNDIPLNMDVELPVQLPADQGSKNVFSKDKAEFLGWAFNRDAKTPAFVASQIVGVDNDQGGGFNGQNGNILYAVWRRTEVTIRVRLIDEKSSAPIAGGSFTLTDSANAEVEGTEGGITSGSDGYLMKGAVRDFNIKTPTIPNTTTSFALTEIENASGYIPLESPVAITVDFDGTIKYRLEDGTEAEATRVDGDCFLIVVKERQAICKVVNGENEKLFSSLREAVEFAKTIPGTASVQMMTDYAVPNTDFVTLTAEDNIALTTASKTGKNPYRGEGTVATVTRGDSGTSMFTVDGGTLDLTNIILDGGSNSNKTCVSDGGIVSVSNGGSLKVEVGTVFQNTIVNSNTNAESSGGAIAAIGANTRVEILGTANNPVQFENCTAKHNGGAVYIGDGATLLAESVSFTDCCANAMGHSVSYGGGAIAVRNGANDAGNPDAIIRNVTMEGCISDGLGGGLLVTGAAVTVSDSTIGNPDSAAGGNSASRGGGLSAADNAYVKVTDSGIYGNEASVKGGAMYVYYAVVAIEDCSVVGNTSELGAGIYVTEGAKLQLYGAPDFGGPGALQDGSLTDSGNFATGTLSGQTNGLADYPKARQDIYLAETAAAPASLEIMGNLYAEHGSIWVWAESELHYQMVKPFAVINSDETITEDTMLAFRNAREDRLTSCRGDYLTGQTGSEPTWIYWTGGVDIAFMKVDGFGDPLAGAQFILYDDLACREENKIERGLAASDVDGIVGYSLISAGIYYMRETKTPNGYKENESKYIVLIGESNLVVPETREGVWTTVLKDIRQEDIDAQVEAYEANEKIGMGGYAIFKLDENNVAVTTPDIAAKGVVNISTAKRLVILSKIDTVLKPLNGAKFILRTYDGEEYKIDGESFESDESGIFFVGELPVGTYYLEETNVPEDYQRPTHFFVFQVTESGVKGLKRNESGADTFEITNTLTEPTSDEYLIP